MATPTKPSPTVRTDTQRHAFVEPLASSHDSPGTTTRIRRSVSGRLTAGVKPPAAPRSVDIVCSHCQQVFRAVALHEGGQVPCIHCGTLAHVPNERPET